MRHAKPPGWPSERACVPCLDLCRLFRVSGIAARVCSTLALVVHAPLSVINMKTTAGRATIVTSYLRWCQHYSSVVVLVSVSVAAVLSVSGCVNETSDWLCLMEGYGPVSRLRCHHKPRQRTLSARITAPGDFFFWAQNQKVKHVGWFASKYSIFGESWDMRLIMYLILSTAFTAAD